MDAAGTIGLAVAGLALVCLLALPLVSLLVRVPPGALLERWRDPAVVNALRLSLVTSAASTAVVIALGLPAAWFLATTTFPGKRLLEVLIDLPLVLPPTVAGVALLAAFGRAGLAGSTLAALGVHLPFTTLGVIVAQAFVAMPFFIGATRAGLAEVEQRYLDTAATLRTPPGAVFLRVMLPLAMPSLLAGTAMSWARALGEFGATITFAGNMPGITQTMPLAVYIALQSDLDAAVALSVMLLLLSLAVLLVLRLAPLGLPVTVPRAHRPTR